MIPLLLRGSAGGGAHAHSLRFGMPASIPRRPVSRPYLRSMGGPKHVWYRGEMAHPGGPDAGWLERAMLEKRRAGHAMPESTSLTSSFDDLDHRLFGRTT